MPARDRAILPIFPIVPFAVDLVDPLCILPGLTFWTWRPDVTLVAPHAARSSEARQPVVAAWPLLAEGAAGALASWHTREAGISGRALRTLFTDQPQWSFVAPGPFISLFAFISLLSIFPRHTGITLFSWWSSNARLSLRSWISRWTLLPSSAVLPLPAGGARRARPARWTGWGGSSGLCCPRFEIRPHHAPPPVVPPSEVIPFSAMVPSPMMVVSTTDHPPSSPMRKPTPSSMHTAAPSMSPPPMVWISSPVVHVPGAVVPPPVADVPGAVQLSHMFFLLLLLLLPAPGHEVVVSVFVLGGHVAVTSRDQQGAGLVASFCYCSGAAVVVVSLVNFAIIFVIFFIFL
mmetsp:Transcript_69013/g.144072  ORF Transcript_69013/g.144072 Transcript_69013/m.144072 type:complete len:347 (+) Transcript_69013:474-1514(+)